MKNEGPQKYSHLKLSPSPLISKTEENMLKFSSRARLVCPQSSSDPHQTAHFLSRQYRLPISTCFICNDQNKDPSEISRWYHYHLHCDTCNFNIHKGCYFQPRCRLSDLAKPHLLSKKYEGFSNCFTCGGDWLDESKGYYHCDTCKVSFHKVCHVYLPEIKHPFHSSHPLTLTISSDSSFSSDFHPSNHLSYFSSDSDSDTNHKPSNNASISDVKCGCCPKQLDQIYYHCSICNFSVNLVCTRNPPPLTISYFKSHNHILTFFPRRIHSPCDACGLENTHDLVYACLPCNYMVHKTCIYLPRVIKITRHPHRLSLSPSLPSGLFSCGVCRHIINVSYGQFSCQKGCHFAVHSKCAVKETVWDGKDLEGVPEEADEDLNSFVRIDDETIQHFSHEHHLKLHGDNNVWGENRFCEACILPILVSECSYSCIECNFILHEACASLPRKKDHPLHIHRLVLHPVPPREFKLGQVELSYLKEVLKCNGCGQVCCGFMYRCIEEECDFHLDMRCASLPDPFIHGSHPDHDLFFNLTKGECMGCKSSDCSPYSLECMECKSFLGLKCATLPSVTRYKHDKHPLTLCYMEEETSSGQYWCEICEAKLDANEWFYACDDYCNVTLHVSCLLGKMFLKPMSFLVNKHFLYSILRNGESTRPVCTNCHRRCGMAFYFQLDLVNSDSFQSKGKYICPMKCRRYFD